MAVPGSPCCPPLLMAAQLLLGVASHWEDPELEIIGKEGVFSDTGMFFTLISLIHSEGDF